MPLWPTLCGLNLWLLALGVPLALAGRPATIAPAIWAMVPLSPLCLLLGMRFRHTGLGQAALVLGVPLLALLPGADVVLSEPRLQPRLAVVLTLALLTGYLALLCRALALSTPAPQLFRKAPGTSASASASAPVGQNQAPLGWKSAPLPPKAESTRLKRRILAHRLLILYTVAVPAVLLYALDLHPAELRALRAAFGTLRRVSAMQATLTAGMVLVWSAVFYFCIMAPLHSYLDHHRELREELHSLRRQAKRGRPRLRIYAYMLLALLGMSFLIIWSLRS